MKCDLIRVPLLQVLKEKRDSHTSQPFVYKGNLPKCTSLILLILRRRSLTEHKDVVDDFIGESGELRHGGHRVL